MSSEAKNLRPYYDSETFHSGYPTVFRPGVGVVDEHGNTIASKITRTSISSFPLKRNNNIGIGKFGLSDRTLRNMAKVTHYNENIQKNMYSDLEFSEYFDWNNIGELVKSLLKSFIDNYIRCLISQPFEAARLLLQVGDFQTIQLNPTKSSQHGDNDANDYERYDNDADDDADETDYFQPKAESENGQILHSRTRTIKRKSRSLTDSSTPASSSLSRNKHHLKPVSLNTVDIMSSLLSTEGARGLWRATHATFILNAVSATLDAWITGFVSPFFNVPDPFFVDVTHSPDPTTTLLLSLASSIITGLLLAPLDIIRTKLIVTRINGSERSIRNSIKSLKFYTVPFSLVIPTILNTLSNHFFKSFTPYLLYVKFGIDSIGSPTLFSAISLLSSFLELFTKLPIETLLRRSQVSYLLKNSSSSNNALKISGEDKLIVKFGGYSGLWRTPFNIYYSKSENSGVEGLFRGWRVGVLNIVGSWGLNILQSNYDDQIFKEEKF